MTMLEYVAKFIELAHFRDDYVATDMAKVRKFEDGLKLSIRGKHGLYDQDGYGHSERDRRCTEHPSASDKRKENQPSSSSRNKQKTSASHGSQGQDHDYQGRG